MDGVINVRYFESFADNEPYILFSADTSSVKKLKNLFQKLAFGEIERVEINSLNFIKTYFGVNIIAAAWEKDKGVERIGENVYQWTVSCQTWDGYAEMLSVFQDGQSVHQYLSFPYNHSSVNVQVSINEYPQNWVGWKKEC